MVFLSRILNRPANERPYLLIPVGYPAPDAKVPAIPKKSLADIMPVVELERDREQSCKAQQQRRQSPPA
jgi:hypothetical protein